uniref:Protein SERAC1 n=1 Tax=Glossina pallidipes TaxID=7398 RepID=A0A1A9ZA14_GLOPL
MLSIDFKNTYDENCNNLLKLTTIPLNSNDDGRVQIRSVNFNSDMTCESNNLSIAKSAAIWRSAATRCNKFSDCDDHLGDTASAAYINNRYRSGEVKIMRKSSTNPGQIVTGNHNKSIRVAFEVILRFLVPLANGVVRGFKGIRDVRFLKFSRSIACSRQTLINLFAFAANTISMNLSVAQVSHRIEPILKLLKIKKSCDGTEILPNFSDEQTTPSTSPTISTIVPSLDLKFLLEPVLPALLQLNRQKTTVEEQIAPKCCTLQILAEPPPGQPIRADIIFIHGLHGSVVKTWRQGLWENERRPVQFDRPPRPPVRPPKRPRHSRTTTARPPHKKKRPRFAYTDNAKQYSDATTDSIDECDENFNNYSENMYPFSCDQTENIQICDGTEYSSPTFRLRMNDNSRLLQAELLEYLLNNENSAKSHEEYLNSNQNLKLTPNDPNYSKCWPGDWLPLDCPGVRVMAVDYTTDSYLWRPVWKNKETRTNLIQRSREMSELLIKYRVGHGHPIVYVGHSKGGLFVKEIIVHAWESGRPAMAPLWRSARGVFFYSVPHRGSHLASIKAPLLIRSVELIDIEKNSKYLLDLHRRFAGLYHLGHLKIEVFSFVETALTLMSLLYLRIVGVDSADPGIGDVCGIRLDHREICKPRSRDCILYKELVKMIKKVC